MPCFETSETSVHFVCMYKKSFTKNEDINIAKISDWTIRECMDVLTL